VEKAGWYFGNAIPCFICPEPLVERKGISFNRHLAGAESVVPLLLDLLFDTGPQTYCSMKNFRYFLMVGLLLSTMWLSTHEAQAQTRSGAWFATFHKYSLNDKLSIHFDGQLRSNDQVKQLQTLLLRTGLNIKTSAKTITTAGYAFINNRRVVGSVIGHAPEHRFWEQFIVNHPIGKASMQHRFRFEQRLLGQGKVQGNDYEIDGYKYANRFRYFFRSVLPFTKSSPFTKGAFGELQNEILLGFGNLSAVNGKTFDQNRFYVAVGYRFSKKFDAEIGYMNQYVEGRGNAFANNHIFQLASYVRL